MISSFLNASKLSGKGLAGSRNQARIQGYIRLKRMYDGWAVRRNKLGVSEWKTLRYNLSRPIVNISSDFLAAKEITWMVEEDKARTELLQEIWTESGGSATFMENALLGAILGDACVIIEKENPETLTKLKWLDPSMCYPEFEPHDYETLKALIIAYDVVNGEGKTQKYQEEWRGGKVTCYLDDKVTESYTYDEKAFGGVPAVWIRNQRVKGDIFGRSDIQPIIDLVEEYDHLCQKMTRVIDYYGSPNIYVKGVTKKQIEMSKGERTMYFLPVDAEMGFVEWKGSAPGIEEHMNRVRETLSELSETPQIAFSKVDSGVSNVSGVALKILYGPLLAKTERKRQSWGPSLEKIMKMALIAEGFTDIKQDDIYIEWLSPLPENPVEDWSVATSQQNAGVSQSQTLKERGYTEQEIQGFQEENLKKEEEAMDIQLKKFNAGTAAKGSPYPDPKKAKKK